MKPLNKAFVTFLVITFITGLYLYTNRPFEKFDNEKNTKKTSDNDDDDNNSCPDLLINKGDILLLYNTKKPEAKGVNPIPFYNLDEYINYLEIQRNKGIRCPVLYVQRENDTQGNDIYRVRPGPFNQEGGLPPSYLMNKSQINHLDLQQGPPPDVLYDNAANLNKDAPVPVLDASRDSSIYNKGNYAGFDPYGLQQGTYSELDKIHDSTQQIFPGGSPNAMDANWGGVIFTENVLNTGFYDENNVSILTG